MKPTILTLPLTFLLLTTVVIAQRTSPPSEAELAQITERGRHDKVEMGFHIAVLDDIPEDTDVFHVLARRPSVPELVGTKQFVFHIETDGTVKYLMTMEAFKKIK